jgi:hypothetical protein
MEGHTSEVINSYLDLHLEIESDCKLRSKHDDKKDDINFPIWLLIISFVSSNFLIKIGMTCYKKVCRYHTGNQKPFIE